jgi:hypothetical protein
MSCSKARHSDEGCGMQLKILFLYLIYFLINFSKRSRSVCYIYIYRSVCYIYTYIYIYIYTYSIRIRYIYTYIYIYIYTSLESYMSRVLNTVVELIRLEDKLELLQFILIQSRFECLRRYSEFHALRDHQATDRYYSILIINTGYHTGSPSVDLY